MNWWPRHRLNAACSYTRINSFENSCSCLKIGAKLSSLRTADCERSRCCTRHSLESLCLMTTEPCRLVIHSQSEHQFAEQGEADCNEPMEVDPENQMAAVESAPILTAVNGAILAAVSLASIENGTLHYKDPANKRNGSNSGTWTQVEKLLPMVQQRADYPKCPPDAA